MQPTIQAITERVLKEFREKFTHKDYSWSVKAFPIEIESFLSTTITQIVKESFGIIAEAREALAELEHDQWIAWSKNIAETETITPARLERWKKLWRPYSELTEAEKDQDREWADKVLSIIRNHHDK